MPSLTYADAGVDIEKSDGFVDVVKKLAKQTARRGVMEEIGGFGGLFSLDVSSLKSPVLVSSTDGVGTKLKLAFMMDKHDTIGIDLVAMCINDILVHGAKPLFFLDYFSTGKLRVETATEVIQGITAGCQQAECALIGGETAEMPGLYGDHEYDLAGFAVGIVDNDQIIDGSDIRVGDQIIGLASSGLHSNGYSLVRKVCFEVLEKKPTDYIEDFGRTLGEELLTPTKIYSQAIMQTVKRFAVHGLAHITGGGLAGNIIRILPQSCVATISAGSWEVPPVFPFLQQGGNISEKEMARTFNNGIGLVLVVNRKETQEVLQSLRAMNEKAFCIGEITARKGDAPQVKWK